MYEGGGCHVSNGGDGSEEFGGEEISSRYVSSIFVLYLSIFCHFAPQKWD